MHESDPKEREGAIMRPVNKKQKAYTVKIAGRRDALAAKTSEPVESIGVNPPLASLFLGPHAENASYWEKAISTVTGAASSVTLLGLYSMVAK